MTFTRAQAVSAEHESGSCALISIILWGISEGLNQQDHLFFLIHARLMQIGNNAIKIKTKIKCTQQIEKEKESLCIDDILRSMYWLPGRLTCYLTTFVCLKWCNFTSLSVYAKIPHYLTILPSKLWTLICPRSASTHAQILGWFIVMWLLGSYDLWYFH